MSRLPRAGSRPARPLRTLLAGGLLAAAVLGSSAAPYAAGLDGAASPAGAGAPAATPTCKEWQTITQVPVRPGLTPTPAPGSTATPTVPMRSVCRNAPPTPFVHPEWDPETVVGGPRLAESGVIVDASADVPPPPEVEDVSYVVADLETGDILAAKSPHAWLRPASTLKTLTALTLLPRVDPDYTVIATEEHVAANGTRVGMVVGNPYKAHYLFDAMLMLSANDAAYGLADAGGGYDETLRLMNEKAAEVGAHDTVAKDPSGLDEEGQRSSAYDLAVIGRAAMQLKDFRGYIVKRTAVFPGARHFTTGRVTAPYQIPNINDLLDHYEGATGIKPGRTSRAQHTFIGSATRDGRQLIVAQMGSTTGSWKPTAALLDWGFAHADEVTPVGRLVEPGEADPPTQLSARPTVATPSAPGGGANAAATGTPAPTAIASSEVSLVTALDDHWPLAALVGGLLTCLVVALSLSWRRPRSARRKPSVP